MFKGLKYRKWNGLVVKLRMVLVTLILLLLISSVVAPSAFAKEEGEIGLDLSDILLYFISSDGYGNYWNDDRDYNEENYISEEYFNALMVVGTSAPSNDILIAERIVDTLKSLNIGVLDEGVMKLDTEIDSPFNSNLIVIGRPCENIIAGSLLSHPDECTFGLKEGQGFLGLYDHDGYTQLLISGYDKEGTEKAAEILVRYIEHIKDVNESRATSNTWNINNYLTGQEMVIGGTIKKPKYEGKREDVRPIEKYPLENYLADEVCNDSQGGDGYHAICEEGAVIHDTGLIVSINSFNYHEGKTKLVLVINEMGEKFTLSLRDVIKFKYKGNKYNIEYYKYDHENKLITLYIGSSPIAERVTDFKVTKPVNKIEIIKDKSVLTTPEIRPEEFICKSGCKENGNCLPYGTRLIKSEETMYCSINGKLVFQQDTGEACQNNYECVSNQCSNGQCIDLIKEIEEAKNFLEEMVGWLFQFFKKSIKEDKGIGELKTIEVIK